MVKQYKSVVWKVHPTMSHGINWLDCSNDLYNQPMFILDADPVRCAQCYTIDFIKQYIKYIEYTLINHRCSIKIKKEIGIEDKPRIDYMLSHQRNAYWFFSLYEEMQKLYRKHTGKYYHISREFKNKWIYDLSDMTRSNVKNRRYRPLDLPSYFSLYSTSELHKDLVSCAPVAIKNICESTKVERNKSMQRRINTFRLLYMLLSLNLADFPGGAPAWFSNMKITIWKSYSKLTRMYYRIDTNADGIYSYYYSIDGESWAIIPNVPIDMRNIIDGIIFAPDAREV